MYSFASLNIKKLKNKEKEETRNQNSLYSNSSKTKFAQKRSDIAHICHQLTHLCTAEFHLLENLQMDKDQEQELMVDQSAERVLSFSWPHKDEMRSSENFHY